LDFAAVLLTTAVKVNVILIFDTNQSFHVRLAFRFFGYEIRNPTIYNTFLNLDIFMIIYVFSIATCKLNLYVFIDSEINFACCVHLGREIVTSSRL
jgi:hypothetical protein